MDTNIREILTLLSNFAVAGCTCLLALATVGVVVQSGYGRSQDERRRKELVFRAALNEIAENIVIFEEFSPLLSNTPEQSWSTQRLQFGHLGKLLESVWIPPQLASRIITVRALIQATESAYHFEVDQLVANKQLPNPYAAAKFRSIDLLLKQIACHVRAEASRQRLEGVDIAPKIAEPQVWNQGDATMFEQNFPPYPSLSPEPEDAAYKDCKLGALVARARDRASKEVV